MSKITELLSAFVKGFLRGPSAFAFEVKEAFRFLGRLFSSSKNK